MIRQAMNLILVAVKEVGLKVGVGVEAEVEAGVGVAEVVVVVVVAVAVEAVARVAAQTEEVLHLLNQAMMMMH